MEVVIAKSQLRAVESQLAQAEGARKRLLADVEREREKSEQLTAALGKAEAERNVCLETVREHAKLRREFEVLQAEHQQLLSRCTTA